MNHQQIVEIANATNRLGAAADLNQRFLAHCASNATPQEFNTQLQVNDSQITIQSFGYMASAACRFVRASDGRFAAEYVFRVPFEDKQVEIWRCYLSADGRIVEDLSGKDPVCDYDNAYIAKHICGRVMLGVLRSALFASSGHEGFEPAVAANE
ncbi:hypothetical protein [Roseateles saccharophilus]|uniref:Uncharacterized protein n=1 Tax=Roseateles saccharophilus TaxID=304 RepID=A0A4R3U864_ROSSA|nr:hypothetical protein [Roseateles saccharophilus]MDG0835775.1 hypothetical protein [Roseateles saccharophilus]TCU84184.1 hypothetical protein EV671_105410 [Roseateles saccharophilus]